MDIALYHRVAPVQAVLNSHLPMAMGYPSFDAVITGLSDDPGQEVSQDQHSETIIRVPGPVISYLTSFEPRQNPALDRAALGLSETDIVMMNAGSSMKLRHESLRAMMRAVVDVPDAKLLLAPYNPGWAARSLAFAFNVQVAETAAELGLEMSRIVILGELSVAEAEAALSCADIYLNPFPHGGATMTHLALIYGVPPVTLRRSSTRSIDQFLVSALGFEELLASTVEEYVALAQSLARDPDRRTDIATRLRIAARTPVFVDSPEHSIRMQRAIETIISLKTGQDANKPLLEKV
jgi:predicted O-linked N-acetylglucosamine transferase (SPINDLY family)